MFSGIVELMGRVARIDAVPAGRRLVVDTQDWEPASGPVRAGDSICVSGVCLTTVEPEAGRVGFDVIAETLARTTLGDLAPGDRVNLEPSLTPATPMGGHFVQGHVEGVGIVSGVQTGGDYRIRIEPPADLMPYIIPKGSITLDGVSMTVAAVEQAVFEVALIPTTLEATTLGIAAAGSRVNLETDIISRTVVHTLRQMVTEGEAGTGAVTRQLLRDAGFRAD